MPEARARKGYMFRKNLALTKCIGVLDRFMADKGESSVELVRPAPIKARDPFLKLMLESSLKTWRQIGVQLGRVGRS